MCWAETQEQPAASRTLYRLSGFAPLTGAQSPVLSNGWQPVHPAMRRTHRYAVESRDVPLVVPSKLGVHVRSARRTAPDTTRSERATSLRASWNRSFAVLLALVLLGGIASIAGTRALVGTFRNTAERVENEATLLAQLRADVATHTGLLHSLVERAKIERPLAAAEAAVRAGFERGISHSDADAGRPFLQQGFDRWLAIVATATPLSPSSPVATIGLGHQALADATEEVAQLLDRAGAASRADARADLARDARGEKRGLAALTALVLLMGALILRFARQLSTQVIRPVGRLRDSANQLAAGDLDHRVELDRADELGDLAVSFNAMADAIAGSQRTLTRQANHDSLTGLANRAAFHARLEEALAHPDRRSGTQAVLFVDLDDFKDVNDTLGHAAGDELLCVVAARLNRRRPTRRPGRPPRGRRVRTPPRRRRRRLRRLRRGRTGGRRPRQPGRDRPHLGPCGRQRRAGHAPRRQRPRQPHAGSRRGHVHGQGSGQEPGRML